MKKLTSIFLAAMMVLSLSVPSFAAGLPDEQLADVSVTEESLVEAYVQHEDGSRTDLMPTFRLQKVMNKGRSEVDGEQYVLTGDISAFSPNPGSDSGNKDSNKMEAQISASIYFTHYWDDFFEGEQYRLDSATATFTEGQDVHMSKTVLLQCGESIKDTVSGNNYRNDNINLSGPRAVGIFTGVCSSWSANDTIKLTLKSPIL